MSAPPYTLMDAEISPCGRYRYWLSREWAFGSGDFVVVGLNPSTADAKKDDPTIRRCVGFAKREGCQRLVMVNLFAFRSTNPRALLGADDPVGPRNDARLAERIHSAAIAVAAWGAFPVLLAGERALSVLRLYPRLLCFGTTKAGHPKHPLYLRADAPLVPFNGPAGKP